MYLVPRAVAATMTVLLHLLILLALLDVTASAVKPPPGPAWQQAMVDKLYETGAQIVSVDIRPALSARGLACAGSSYVGVGVTAELRTERIMLVGDDTPASRAGLQHDDIVLNPDIWEDAHTEGALLQVLILREGVKLAVALQVGRICIG